jgi:hypothetical protein
MPISIAKPDHLGGRVRFIDRELAMCGDPLYDVATLQSA